ncbi:MAG: hypothetical protein IPG10_08875 [Flavobacteriales bacterium]|nr:hypothetical protein [Flavobacteriales bacterium]
MEQLQMLPDVKFCLTADTTTVIPVLQEGVLVPLSLPALAQWDPFGPLA